MIYSRPNNIKWQNQRLFPSLYDFESLFSCFLTNYSRCHKLKHLSTYRDQTSHKYEHSRSGVKKRNYLALLATLLFSHFVQRNISLLLGNNSAVMVKCSVQVQPAFIPGIEKQ